MSKVTDWFSGDVRPSRVGVYETLIANDLGFQYWTGEHWGRTSHDAERAAKMALSASHFQQPHWRGLATDPAEGAQ